MGDDHEPSFNFRLIEAVRQYRCLYDSTDRQYRSSEFKMKVWSRLVQSLGFDGDSRTLYNRWKQLRDKYGKEKKKIKYHGDSTSWQYFKHLNFLDPHMVDRTQQKYMRIGKDGKEQIATGGNGEEYDSERQVVISDPNFANKLIGEVQKQPCLFDIRDPKYRHSEFRSQAWSEIIKTLQYPGDISSIYKQWKKVRDRYVREKRKLRMAGSPPEDTSWGLFTQMVWIDPYLDDRTTSVNKRKRDSDEMSEDMMFEDMHSGMIPHYSMVDELQQGHINGSPGLNRSQHHQAMTASPQAVHQQQTQHIQQHQATQNPNQFILNPTDLVDGERAFALSVIADLRTLPEQSRQLARAQIQSLCDSRNTHQIVTSSAQQQHAQQQQQQQQHDQQQQQNQYHLAVK